MHNNSKRNAQRKRHQTMFRFLSLYSFHHTNINCICTCIISIAAPAATTTKHRMRDIRENPYSKQISMFDWKLLCLYRNVMCTANYDDNDEILLCNTCTMN